MGLSALSLVLILGLAFFARYHDGPIGPIPGGVLRSGDWLDLYGPDRPTRREVTLVELQTLSTARSRTTGLMEQDGTFYLPCDLGFIARRAPRPTRWIMQAVIFGKRWHEAVVGDGRVVLRVDGNRYAARATSVDDPAVRARLEAEIEAQAARFLGGPLDSTRAPGPIRFFRLEERAAKD